MKIMSLQAENVLRLKAVRIAPDPEAALVVVAGKNGQGKSSVLDAIAMALGGANLVPEEPIRRGEDAAEIQVDLGDYVVTRRFWRDGDAVKSSLDVETKDGSVRAPQSLLDRLVSDVAWDPLAFLELKPKAQRDALQAFFGVDLDDLDEMRPKAIAKITDTRRELDALERRLAAAPAHDDAPANEIDVRDLVAELEAAEQAWATGRAACKDRDDAAKALFGLGLDVENGQKAVVEAMAALERARAKLVDAERAYEDGVRRAEELKTRADEVVAALPDKQAIHDRIAGSRALNRKYQENRERDALAHAIARLRDDLAAAKTHLAALDEERVERLSRITFPVEGLAFGEDRLTLHGLPFEQASTAERLRTAVAVGTANDKPLKVVVVKAGNDLDDDGLALLASLAEERGAQVWVERIAGGPAAVTIVDGEGGNMAAPAPTDEKPRRRRKAQQKATAVAE